MINIHVELLTVTQDNKEAMAVRAQCALDALEDVCRWLEAGGEVGVSAFTL